MAEIDSLTVGVGISSDEFRKGIDEILGSINGMRSSTEEAAAGMGASFSEMGASVAGLALKFGGLFFAIRGIEDVVGYFKDLSSELASLGFAGQYLGQSSVALSRWGEIARKAGGNAEDAVTAVQSLQSAIFGLEYNGQMSQNLLMLNRLRVAYTDQQGRMLPISDIAMNAAAALQQQLPGQANTAMRVSWAAQIFGQGGLANAIGGGVAELRKFYAESSKDQKGITQKLIDSQKSLQQNLIGLSYQIRSEAGEILGRLTPAIEDLIGVIRDDLVPTLDELIGDILHPIKAFENAATTGPLGLSHPINDAAHFMKWFKDLELRHLGVAAVAGMSVPASVMARLPGTTNLDLLKLWHLEEGGDSGDPTWSKALTSYIGAYGTDSTPDMSSFNRAVSQGRGGVIPRAYPTPRVPRAFATPGAARPSVPSAQAGSKPTAATGGPRVNVGGVTINTAATDANGIAASIDRALRRKLLVAQADPGLA